MNIPKYRAWHKQFKLMMPVLEINLDPEHGGVFVESKDGHYCGCRLYMDLWPWSDIELMQFTEYTDCESKDIYGGDRVRTDNEQRYDTPVDEHYQGVVFYDEIRAMYRIKQSGSNYMPALTNDAIVSIEVIGNIWENSDLLAQEQQS